MLDILGEAALRTLLLAGVVQGALWLLRVRNARLLLATWTIVLAASTAMPLLLRFTPLHLPLDMVLPRPLIDDAAILVQRPSLRTSPADAAVVLQTQPSSGSWLQAVYVVVGCGLALRVALGVGLSLRMLARAAPIYPEWAAGTRVRISPDIAGPVTIANVILLPVDVVDWSSGTREAVLAHERAHVARRDFALLIVSQLNRALFWFSPLSWWLHHRLVGLTELASDDQAIALTRDRLGYAEVLLEMGRRSRPVSRGPAMARPSTLPHRIDRILLDQATSCCVSRPQQALLMIAVLGVSLAMANLIPGQVPVPAVTLFAQRSGAQDHQAFGLQLDEQDMGDPAEQGIAAPQARFQEESSTTTSPQPVTQANIGRRARPASAPLPSAPPDATVAPSAYKARPAPPHPAARISRKTTTILQPLRVTRQPDQVAIDLETRIGPAPRAFSPQEISSPGVGGSGAVTTDGPVSEGGPSSPSRMAADGYPPTNSRTVSEQVMDRTCTGTIAIGPGAWQGLSWPNQHPNIVAGQTLPSQARFFHRANGTAWVRFNAFGRPALDLPVRLVRSGMTWTGEYGIAYTVQA